MKTSAVEELIAKGNIILHMDCCDLAIGVNCWRIVPGMEDMIDIAVKAARKQKYGKKGELDGG